MSQQMQKPKEVGFSFLSDLLKAVQPTERKGSCHASPPKFDLDFELKTLQTRVNALSRLCERVEHRIPQLNNTIQVAECALEIVIEVQSFKRTAPDSSNRGKIIDYLRILLKLLGLIKSIAAKVLIAAGIAHAIVTIVINCYDLINGDVDPLDAILDIVTSIAELVPLTGINDAREIQSTMQTGCRAVSSFRRAVEPMKDNSSAREMIQKLADIERCFLDCQAFANQCLK